MSIGMNSVYSAAFTDNVTRREGEYAAYPMTVRDGRQGNHRFHLDIEGFELMGAKRLYKLGAANAETYSTESDFEEWKKTGSDFGYHYMGSAIWFNRIGKAMGDAMLGMIKN